MPHQIKLECPDCKKIFLLNVIKEELFSDKSGLLSGIFLHTSPANEKHGLLVYFDNELRHRGTVVSLIQK